MTLDSIDRKDFICIKSMTFANKSYDLLAMASSLIIIIVVRISFSNQLTIKIQHKPHDIRV